MCSQVNISVRTLVEYVYRSGSIESGFKSASGLVEGTRIHKAVQQSYTEEDQTEVYLKTEIHYKGILFHIEGRCDGLLWQDEEWVVDEIKSTFTFPEEGTPVHWAQAMFYGYMIAEERDLSHIQLQLTYVHKESGAEKRFRKISTRQELEDFVLQTVAGYEPYASLRHKHDSLRDASIQALPFPFTTYRKGQRQLAGAVYKTIVEEQSLFVKAPTGIGKTLSTLFPSIKAMGEGMLQRIFYLTAKTITRTAAEEALSLMERKGLHIHAVTITAKDKICFREEGGCSADACPFRDGYYDRINGAILDLLEHETLISRSVVEIYARRHQVCPFEMSLDAAYAADVIICDYNYVFDPRINLKRLAEESKKRSALLVDEAHNLVERGREMFSSALLKSDFLALGRAYKESNSGLAVDSKAINQYFIDVRKQSEESRTQIWTSPPDELIPRLEKFVVQAEMELLKPRGQGTDSELLLDCYFAVQNFIRIAKQYDEHYVTYAEITRKDVYYKLFNLDPSSLLHKISKGYRSKIFFSATLAPLSYYREMIGAEKEDYGLSIPSPFSKDQLKVSIVPLSTRYHDRPSSLEPIADLLGQLVQERKGNYLVFFPSYEYMRDAYERFTERYAEVDTLLQDSGMTEEAREQFLDAFHSENQRTLLGFAVLGGIFSEGVDLPGDRLNGVVVVGVGLPQLSLERNILRDYFARTSRNGYDYAYVYPGMNKVLQAGGRLIRTEEDEGVIMLVDDRFLQPKYQQLLPEEWRN